MTRANLFKTPFGLWGIPNSSCEHRGRTHQEKSSVARKDRRTDWKEVATIARNEML